ncbi:single-stranded DNA-binding protein [Xanthobacter sp. TB0136]|uniref:single-stranded DNA-binding protein n=1 Tax=Xanthobacter sp. TB0136 TaxID=3459177 RepID=UPI004039183A
MVGSVNKVILVGNLGRDPEIKTFQNGGRLCNLSVATSESWKDKSTDEWRDRTEWHRVVITNDRLIDTAQRLRKGMKVYVEGQIETRKYQDRSGRDAYTTEIVLRPFRGELKPLESTSDRPPAGTPEDYDHQSTGREPGMDDDEIPF